MDVIGLDPGKVNFSFARIIDGRLTTYGNLPTITEMNEQLVEQTDDFVCSFESMIPREVDLVTVERMQHRPGMGGGAVVEYINLMIGMVMLRCRDRGIRVLPVSPARWKSHWRKAYGLPSGRFSMTTIKMPVKQPPGSKFKKRLELVQGVLGTTKLTPHQADAIGIAAYGYWQETEVNVLPAVKELLCVAEPEER